jgi:uncharacterized membrane protein
MKRPLAVLGAYWVRGALYIIALSVLFYTLQPVVEYAIRLEEEYGSVATLLLVLAVAPTLVGLFGSWILSPLLNNWQTIKGAKPWEDRIVDELTPGKRREFPIVLVPWPNEKFRTPAILANRYMSSCGTTELACVYMPHAPDPTRGGDIRVLPADSVEITDWSLSDLFSSYVTYGATGPKLFSTPPEGDSSPGDTST